MLKANTFKRESERNWKQQVFTTPWSNCDEMECREKIKQEIHVIVYN